MANENAQIDAEYQASLQEVIDHDPDAGERADAQEAELNRRLNPVEPDNGWIVDECNTPNGKGYFVNKLWDDEEGETHTDEIAEICMDYRDPALPLRRAQVMAAAPELLAALRGVLKVPEAAKALANWADRELIAAYSAIAKAEGGAR